MPDKRKSVDLFVIRMWIAQALVATGVGAVVETVVEVNT